MTARLLRRATPFAVPRCLTRLAALAAIAFAGACGPPLVPAIPAPQPVPAPVPEPTRTPPVTPPPVSQPPAPPVKSAPPATAPVAPPPIIQVPPPPVVREFRGAWVASVANIDWPSSRNLTTVQQQKELLDLLDRAVALNLNAIIFQVRPAADALYASTIEPWSEYLTGAQGRAPNPYWDPLEFAVREAHARGLELHAWFNPYRARDEGAKSPLAANHIAKTNPSLVKQYGGFLWMDPAEPEVRARTLRVVLDVVKRYDVDGVHIDDYFYPYPETNRRGAEIPFPDDRSWQRYRSSGGTLSRGDWRRSNVDSLVRALNDGVHRTKPWVRFGVSPFGIWQPGYPAGVRGLNAYTDLFADARKWLREGWLDYFTPQLYWPTTSVGQSYSALLAWWIGENYKGRHIWAGNFTSRAGGPGASAFSVAELLEQIRVSRTTPGSTGNVHFSMVSFLRNQAGMNDALVAGPYAQPALPPASPWLAVSPPPRPVTRIVDGENGPMVVLSTDGRDAPWQWLVRFRSKSGWQSRLLRGSVTRWAIPSLEVVSAVWVQSLNRVGTESAPVQVMLTNAGS